MSVSIQNVSEQYGIEYGKGEQTYALRINIKVITIFTHKFEDGLASLLRTAADEVDKVEEK